MTELADWVVDVWRKRGIVAEREAAASWLRGQNIAALERLKASGKPALRDERLNPYKVAPPASDEAAT